MKRLMLTIAIVLATASLAAAQTVFVVRHAERADAAATQGAHGAPAREQSGARPEPGRGARATEPVSGAEPRQEMMAADPELSAVGRARAEALASMLKDAGVTAIFATEYKRTQQTAAPLAKLLGISVQTVTSKDTPALAGRVKSAKGNVLIVGHSNTVPEILKALGIATPVTIAEADYDNLFVVTPREQPVLLRLHYR